MPDEATDRYPTYAANKSDEAQSSLASLPKEIVLAWVTEIESQILKDPVGHPMTNPKGRSGTIYLFRQPSLPLEVLYEVDNEKGIVYFEHFTAPLFQQKSNRIVTIYSKNDRQWFDDLYKWIGDLEKDGLIEVWDVSKIPAGADFHEEVSEALASARVALVLVTQDFIVEDFQDEKLRLPDLLKARDEGAFEIQWISVKTAIPTTLLKMKALNHGDEPLYALAGHKRDEAFLNIHAQLQALAKGW